MVRTEPSQGLNTVSLLALPANLQFLAAPEGLRHVIPCHSNAAPCSVGLTERDRIAPGPEMKNHTFEAFETAYTASARQIGNLVRMEDAISSLGFPSFFEPISVLDGLGTDSSAKLVGPWLPR